MHTHRPVANHVPILFRICISPHFVTGAGSGMYGRQFSYLLYVAMNGAGGGWDGWQRVQCCQLQAGPSWSVLKRGPRFAV